MGIGRLLLQLLHRGHAILDHLQGMSQLRIAGLLRVGVGRRLSPAWSRSISGSNLFDEQYFRSADDKASAAPGRSFGLQIVRD